MTNEQPALWITCKPHWLTAMPTIKIVSASTPGAVPLYARPAALKEAQAGDAALTTVLRDAFEWQKRTFPHATPLSCAAHLLKEAQELFADPTDASEMADVLLLLSNMAASQGIDLAEAVRAKMEINYQRQWGEINEQGFVEHVRGDARILPKPAPAGPKMGTPAVTGKS